MTGNVISWTETLASGELVMMTERKNGDIIMYRLDGSQTIMSLGGRPSESSPDEPVQQFISGHVDEIRASGVFADFDHEQPISGS